MPWYIKAVLRIALPAACLAALYLSIPGEVALAKTAGWSEHYAPAMPICLSVYALAAGAISGFRRKMRLPGEKTALIGGVMALALAMGAQSISHLIEQSYMAGSAALTVAVSCIPPLVIAHLIHMAETPAVVRTASEELEELREVSQSLMTELVASESAALASHTRLVLRELGAATNNVSELNEETEELNERLEEALGEEEAMATEEQGKTQKKRLSIARSIEGARESLAAQGKKATVARVCETLGISSATYYRYYQPKTDTSSEGMLSFSVG
ncbi:hypothetical protein ACFYY2_12010 [Streptomyces sp. NPDC001822]|uniref:hypothetical protein n=1 Tax=Streptomyces sp. NPDC001822 TaxID=3364614 RepID=UPI00367F79B6